MKNNPVNCFVSVLLGADNGPPKPRPINRSPVTKDHLFEVLYRSEEGEPDGVTESSELDSIYNFFGDLFFYDRDYASADRVLGEIDVERMTCVTRMLGVLTITLSHRERLPTRGALYQKVRQRLGELGREHDIDALMQGLE